MSKALLSLVIFTANSRVNSTYDLKVSPHEVTSQFILKHSDLRCSKKIYDAKEIMALEH